jgi:hypothetical protein
MNPLTRIVTDVLKDFAFSDAVFYDETLGAMRLNG